MPSNHHMYYVDTYLNIKQHKLLFIHLNLKHI